MSAIVIYRIGPLDGVGTSLYVPHSSDPLEVVDARNDDDGIAKIVSQRPEARFVCSPDLAAAAARAGLAVEPLEPVTQGTRIWTAMTIAQAPDLDAIMDPWSMLALMNGLTDYVVRGAASAWPRRLSIDAELRGDRQGRLFGALLDAPAPGLVLFDAADLAKQCALLDGPERLGFVAAHDHLMVSFERPPPYAEVWITDFFGIDVMPRPTRRLGDKVPASDEDALILGGVLSAMSLMEDLRETRYSVVKSPGRVVRTFVSPGEPWPLIHMPDRGDGAEGDPRDE